ncbi:MAG TPA: RidA family protein [Gemmatimonadaceae bacterium]|nr:RidA family protein [Gemmatimonadaceae bacterium]
MRTISTPNAPIPAGHYSQAVEHNGLIYVAGQLGIDPKRPGHTPDDIELQTEQTLRNVANILIAAGSDLSRVLSMTIYISDISDWSRVNGIYSKVLGAHKPARAVIPVKDLHYGFGIEIQCVAAVAGSP